MTISVLVVDDEPDMMELFRRRFRRELRSGAYAMKFAGSGRDALDLLDKDVEPELMLILSDVNMPGMSGLELLRHSKARFPALPVIMITAYGDEERRNQAFEIGASDFLAKPIDFDALKERIAGIVTEGSTT